MVSQEQYDEYIEPMEGSINSISNFIANIEYPDQPNQDASRSRQASRIDFKKLLKQGLVPFRPKNAWATLKDAEINGYKCSYFGQVSKESKKLEGIGLAVSASKKVIFEGGFKDGKLCPLYRIISTVKFGTQ